MKSCRPTLFLLLAAMLLVACKPTIPGKYIQPDDLEDILYDYHIADGVSAVMGQHDDTLQMNIFKKSVLAKHGYTEQQFDSSMAYYIRHAELMHKIYESLEKRIESEADAMGVASSDFNVGSLSASGDTTNIWPGERTMILSQQPAFNLYAFELKADTSYHAGDRFIFSCDAQFVFKDGSRNAVMLLAVRLGNDSIVTRTCHMSSTMRHKLEYADTDRLGVKGVSGYIFLARNMSDEAEVKSTSLRMLVLSNLSLIKMHTPEPEPQPEQQLPADSVKTDSAAAPPAQAVRPTSTVKPTQMPQTPAQPTTRELKLHAAPHKKLVTPLPPAK